jgi:hypothetical protein
MAVWELIRDAMAAEHGEGREWLVANEIVRAVQSGTPGTNRRTITLQVKSHCINDRTKGQLPNTVISEKPFVRD